MLYLVFKTVGVGIVYRCCGVVFLFLMCRVASWALAWVVVCFVLSVTIYLYEFKDCSVSSAGVFVYVVGRLAVFGFDDLGDRSFLVRCQLLQ